MKIRISLFIISLFICAFGIKSQTNTYVIEKVSFGSDRYDEFSPVFYTDGLVFCSNRGGSSLVDYTGGGNNGPISIFFVERNDNGNWKKPKIFSKDLTTKFNDGPITFNSEGDISYYSRNMFVIRDQKRNPYYRNKLGLFSANKSGKDWDNITPFRHNNDWFNITTPYLSPDGQRLYFSSDKPDGFGGADLYYCEWKNGYWGDPVNLGPEVNTAGNEAYPFVNTIGELFFSSDGHHGLGGKDIFVTKPKGDGWNKPVHLDAPINSEYDDFGIVTDTLMDSGFFSSQRGRTLDIFSFNTQKHHVWFAQPQQENNYCISLKDEGSIEVDSFLLEYEWDFGSGVKQYGKQVRYCFPETGNYTVNLNIVDRKTKELFFHKSTYQIEINNFEQPFINSVDYAMVGDLIRIDALNSYHPHHKIKDFYWQINDTTFKTGAEVTYLCNRVGENTIRLAVTLQSKHSGEISKQAVSKTIQVFGQESQKNKFLEEQSSVTDDSIIVADTNTFRIKRIFGVDENDGKESVFRLQLMVSDKKVALDSPVFKSVSTKYNVFEIFDLTDSTFSYVIDEQRELISLYLAYEDIKASGFEGAKVIYSTLTEPAGIELFRIKEKYGVQTDKFFSERNTLKTNGILMLNSIVGLMHKFPGIKLQIDVHTDNVSSAYRNKISSQSLAQSMADYLVSTGISKNRLIPQGKGEELPIRSNLLESGRKKNRRVEFKIIYQNDN